MKEDVTGKAALTSVPDMVLAPDHVPLAEQAVALVLLQLSVVVAPDDNEIGLAERVTVGVAGEVTLTVTLAEVFPPDPVQASV